MASKLLTCDCDPFRAAWGGFSPNISVEYDEGTGHLLFVTVRYNKRIASKCVHVGAREPRCPLVHAASRAQCSLPPCVPPTSIPRPPPPHAPAGPLQ